MKRKWKTNGLKRSIAVLMAAALAFTMQGSMGFSAEAEGTATTETTAVEKVLFESNYDGVSHHVNCRDGVTENNTAWYNDLAGQVFTQNIDGNGYLEYSQGNKTLGVIRLGHTYEQKTMEYTPITVTAGKTYVIEFDMRVNAAQWVVKNNLTDSRIWPDGSDLSMGVAVGPATESLYIQYSDYIKNTYTANWKVFDSLAKGSKVVSTAWEGNKDGWVHRKWVYTVPEDCDLSTNNALQLFFAGGQRCAVSIDNIKVTTAELVTSEVLFDTDYETAIKMDISATNCYPIWTHTQNFSGDLRPAYLAEEKNTVLYYRQSNYGLGVVVLGHDYVGNANQDTAAGQNAIKVTAGTTYKVTFDYKVRNSIGPMDLSIGLAVGKPSFDFKTSGVNGNIAIKDGSKYVSQYTTELTFTKNITPAQEWHTTEAFITVPKEADVTTYNTLLLYAKYGGQGTIKDENGNITDYSGVYFDNIKVTKVTDTHSIYADDTTLFESGYDNVYTYSDETNGLPWIADTLVAQGGDICGYTDPDDTSNKVLFYYARRVAFGVIMLGDEYTQRTATTDAITVKKGISYKINFRYKTTGTPTNSNLTVGIGLYSGSANGAKGPGSFLQGVSQQQPEIVLSKGTAGDGKWKEYTAYYTVDDDTDITTNNKLCIYAITGYPTKVFFDDITVTELAGVNVTYTVDGKKTASYNSDGNIPYNAMLDNETNTAVKWYKDAAHTDAFISADYTRTGTLGSQTLYGERDRADIAFVKGDASGDGVVDADDLSTLRNGLLGDAITYATRAECNEDSFFDIKDLVRAARIANGDTSLQSGLKIDTADLSSYKVVTEGVNVSDLVVTTRVDKIKTLGNMDDANTNEITVTLNTALSPDRYILEVKDNSVRVEGGSVNAVAAALEVMLGYIKAGVSMDSTCSMEFIYTGTDYTAYATQVLNEGFR